MRMARRRKNKKSKTKENNLYRNIWIAIAAVALIVLIIKLLTLI
jgi:anti-sigma-K factor RskA